MRPVRPVKGNKLIPAKVGTKPALVILYRRYALRHGQFIWYRNASDGSRWESGIVTKTEPILFIDQF